MPVATGSAIAAGIGGIAGAVSAAAPAIGAAGAIASGVGGLVGGLSDKSSSTTSSVRMAPASQAELQAGQNIQQDYGNLRGLVDVGPGASDVGAGTGATRDLASMLQSYQQSGGLPSSVDVTQAQGLAGGLFQGRRNALMAGFEEQRQGAAQNAAVMGRNLNDPVLRNKLAQEETRQQLQLEAEQGSLANQLALQQPGRRLGFAQQRADVLQGLASQAMSNRQALLSIGEGIQTNERNFRLSAADRTNMQTQQGSLAQGLAGGLAGLGAGMSAIKGFSPGAAPAQAPAQNPYSLGVVQRPAPGGNIFGVNTNPFQ